LDSAEDKASRDIATPVEQPMLPPTARRPTLWFEEGAMTNIGSSHPAIQAFEAPLDAKN
jgi:hypothetical protein